MLRLDQLYFRNFFVLFFITLLVSAISGYFVLKKVEINNHRTMLVNMIEQFSIIESNTLQIDKIIQKIKEKTDVRVTIINAQGVVLYESDRAVDGMENHLNRPELTSADTKGIGSSIRYSESLGIDFLYVAKFENMRYIRMAYALDSIQAKFFQFWLKAMGLFALAMVLAFWLALRINQKITDDLKRIKKSLENLLNKKYDVDLEGVSCCKEFETISKQIDKVSLKLEKRDRQKAKYTKKLKLHSKKQEDIISSISHEFKNPVAAIMGYTQTVKEDAALSPALRDKFLDKVTKNAKKITLMIDRLSLAIKLENDNFKPDFSTFKLALLAEDVRETLLYKYPNREINLEIEPIMISADRGMFDNLLTNLIENALKYSEDSVLVKTQNSKLVVSDKGIGIAPEDMAKITKRFFRVDSLSWDNSMGVGLYIVKYILKLHESVLEIESTPDEGSKFAFDLSHLVVKD